MFRVDENRVEQCLLHVYIQCSMLPCYSAFELELGATIYPQSDVTISKNIVYNIKQSRQQNIVHAVLCLLTLNRFCFLIYVVKKKNNKLAVAKCPYDLATNLCLVLFEFWSAV